MQIGGVGSGHDTYSHQVTECLHEHAAQTDTGSMANKMADGQETRTATEILQDTSNENMMSWVQKIGNSGKQLLQKIWGESKEANDAITSQNGSGNHSRNHNYTGNKYR